MSTLHLPTTTRDRGHMIINEVITNIFAVIGVCATGGIACFWTFIYLINRGEK